jgi:hypothetical protein
MGPERWFALWPGFCVRTMGGFSGVDSVFVGEVSVLEERSSEVVRGVRHWSSAWRVRGVHRSRAMAAVRGVKEGSLANEFIARGVVPPESTTFFNRGLEYALSAAVHWNVFRAWAL